MDQDIRFQVPMTLASTAGAAYLTVPYRCVLRDIKGTMQAAESSIMSSATSLPLAVTEITSSTSLGAVAIPLTTNNVAAAAAGTYTPNASSSLGSTVLAAGTVIKVAAASLTSAANVVLLDIELDPYAREL